MVSDMKRLFKTHGENIEVFLNCVDAFCKPGYVDEITYNHIKYYSDEIKRSFDSLNRKMKKL